MLLRVTRSQIFLLSIPSLFFQKLEISKQQLKRPFSGLQSKQHIKLRLDFDLHVTFTIPPRSKINPKYSAKVTFYKEMRQCLTATTKVTVIVPCYLISKESTFYVQDFIGPSRNGPWYYKSKTIITCLFLFFQDATNTSSVL